MAPSSPVRIVDADGNPIGSSNPLPTSGAVPVGGATAAKQDTVIAALAAIQAAAQILDNIVSGNEAQVDVLTQPDNRESWRASLVADVTANDSDMTFTVPANTEYIVESIFVTLASPADVGNRQLTVHFLSAADVIIARAPARVVQAASLTYTYMFATNLVSDTAVYGTHVNVSLPYVPLAAGQKIRVYDSAAIAAAADDMTVQMQVASRSVA